MTLGAFLRGGAPRTRPNPTAALDAALSMYGEALAVLERLTPGRRPSVRDEYGGSTPLRPLAEIATAARRWASEEGEGLVVAELHARTARLRAAFPEAEAAVAREAAEAADQRAWERQAYAVPYPPRAPLGDAFAGRLVWLYHGTSTEKLHRIEAEGVRHDAPKRSDPQATRGRVFLSANPQGRLRSREEPGATMYAQRAAFLDGSEPVVLRVIVPWDWLQPDQDDTDLSCAHFQWETPRTLLLAQVMELDGIRRRAPLGDHEPWREGYVGPRDVRRERGAR